MIVHALIGAILFVVSATTDLLAEIVPASLVTSATNAVSSLASMFNVGPMSTVVVLMVAWFVVDTALNLFMFAWNVYRLIPFKMS